MYVEVSGKKKGDKATLESPYYSRRRSQCLEFWYHMYGINVGTLNVYTKQLFFRRLVWAKSGNQGNLWRKAQVPLSLFFGVSLSFEAIRGDSPFGDIAIDDVSLIDGQCPRPGDCSFEKGRCSWLEVRATDTFDWILGYGSTSSFGTGPPSDHTLGTAQG